MNRPNNNTDSFINEELGKKNQLIRYLTYITIALVLVIGILFAVIFSDISALSKQIPSQNQYITTSQLSSVNSTLYNLIEDVKTSLENSIASIRNQANNNITQAVQNVNQSINTLNSTLIEQNNSITVLNTEFFNFENVVILNFSNIQTQINYLTNNMIIGNLTTTSLSISNFGSQPFPPNVVNAFFTVSNLSPTPTPSIVYCDVYVNVILQNPGALVLYLQIGFSNQNLIPIQLTGNSETQNQTVIKINFISQMHSVSVGQTLEVDVLVNNINNEYSIVNNYINCTQIS